VKKAHPLLLKKTTWYQRCKWRFGHGAWGDIGSAASCLLAIAIDLKRTWQVSSGESG